MTPERKIKTKVAGLLKSQGIWYFFPFSFGAGTGGIPDIVAIIRGRFVGIEVKANAKAKLSALQVRQRDAITSSGGVWLRVHDDETLGLLMALIQGETK